MQGWVGSCKGGWLMQGWGGSSRGGLFFPKMFQGCGRVGHVEVGWGGLG